MRQNNTTPVYCIAKQYHVPQTLKIQQYPWKLQLTPSCTPSKHITKHQFLKHRAKYAFLGGGKVIYFMFLIINHARLHHWSPGFTTTTPTKCTKCLHQMKQTVLQAPPAKTMLRHTREVTECLRPYVSI